MAHPSTEPLVLGVALVIVNLLTGIFSFIKESAAASLSRDIERLVPNNARVIRECIESVEPAEELVVGDILVRKYLLTQSSEIRALCLMKLSTLNKYASKFAILFYRFFKQEMLFLRIVVFWKQLKVLW